MEVLKAIFTILAFVGALFFTAKAIYHTYHVVTNVTGKYSGFFSALLLLMPSQFNEQGNKHRVALGPTILALMACWLVLFLTGAVSR